MIIFERAKQNKGKKPTLIRKLLGDSKKIDKKLKSIGKVERELLVQSPYYSPWTSDLKGDEDSCLSNY